MYRIRRTVLYLSLFIAALLQASAPGLPWVRYVKPDILLASVIFFSLYGGKWRGLEAGIFAGFLHAVFSVTSASADILVYGLCGYLLGCNYNKFYKESLLLQVALSFASVLVAYGAYYLYQGTTSAAYPFFYVLTGIIMPSAIFTACASPVIFFILKKLVRPVRYI